MEIIEEEDLSQPAMADDGYGNVEGPASTQHVQDDRDLKTTFYRDPSVITTPYISVIDLRNSEEATPSHFFMANGDSVVFGSGWSDSDSCDVEFVVGIVLCISNFFCGAPVATTAREAGRHDQSNRRLLRCGL